VSRSDLGCPFGCRQAHRRAGEKKRCREYYQSDAGKIKKSYLNARRKQSRPAEQSAENQTPRIDCGVDPTIVFHIQKVISWIEGRSIGLQDIVKLINRRLRQLSFEKSKKISYAGRYHKNRPP
jgi:hypothetical protein